MTDAIFIDATPAALQVFEIPAEHMPGLLDKLAKLSKKSEKLIGKPINLNVLRELQTPLTRTNVMGRQVPVLDADGNPCLAISYAVTIDAETPRINGWTFVATIDHSAATGNIIRNNPNAVCEIPTLYRTVKPVCDHCGKIRSRRDTFLLHCDATGEFKQIGRQCIRDFIGYDVTSVVAMAEIVSSATPSDSDGASDWSGGMRDRRYIFVKTYLTHVAAIVRTVGWISRKDAEFGRGVAPRRRMPTPTCSRRRRACRAMSGSRSPRRTSRWRTPRWHTVYRWPTVTASSTTSWVCCRKRR